MSLKNMETGQTATPLAMLQEMNEQDRQHIKTDLLKEALAISNEKCNKLIEMQNKLIEEIAGGYGGDGVQSDNNRGQSGTGNQNGNRENREAQREHRNTSQKGGFDFCK